MESIFNINIDKNNIQPWNNLFTEVTDSVNMKINPDFNYRRFISKYSSCYSKGDIKFDYYFVIEFFNKENISYYTLSITPDKYALYKERVDEIIEAFRLNSIDALTENICFDYGYCVSIGQISSEKNVFEPELMNEISYVSSVMKDIMQFYLNNQDNQYGVSKVSVMNFLCNNKNFL